jgi:hypothetical protein
MKTQKEQVLVWLKKKRKRGITSWDAITNFHITRLADVIFKLKTEGHDIFTIIEKAEGKKWARYILLKEAR